MSGRGDFTMMPHLKKIITVYLFIICCCGWILFSSAEIAVSDVTVSGKQAIEDYKQFLGTLNIKEKESILTARDEFIKRFSDAPETLSDEAFRSFEVFYKKAVFVCDRIYFFPKNLVIPEYKDDNRYKKEYQVLLNAILQVGSTVTKELLQDDPLEHFERLNEDYKKEIREKYGAVLDELYEFKKCGMTFVWGEGDWYLKEDPDFLLSLSSNLKGEHREFTRFMGEEAKQRLAEDAALAISWDELRQRIIRWETFAGNHPDLPETEDTIKPQLHRMMQWYLIGIDNTRAYDYDDTYGGTAKINSELLNSYENFLRENTDSSYFTLIQGVCDILKKHDFKCQKELGDYIIKNGFEVYYWREYLKK